MLMCMERKSCHGLQCSCYTEHGRYGLSCLYAETVECMSRLRLYGMFGFKLCHDILLLLNTADMDRWKTGVSNAEYLVHLVSMNRLSACREFCGVHSW